MGFTTRYGSFSMLKSVGVILLVFSVTAVLSLTAAAVNLQADYFKSIGNYYGISTDEVEEISQTGIVDEDLPVVFFVADHADAAPKKVANMRHNGASWSSVCEKYSIKATDFYIIISGSIKSEAYGPIYEKFNTTPQRKWKEIQLTDDEMVNMVNLKLIYSLHDYSVYEIMAMRDFGKSFTRINQQVYLAKEEMNEERNKVLEAR